MRLAWDYGKIKSQKHKPTIKTTVCVCMCGEIRPHHRVGVRELELTAQQLSLEPRSTLTLFAQKDSLWVLTCANLGELSILLVTKTKVQPRKRNPARGQTVQYK